MLMETSNAAYVISVKIHCVQTVLQNSSAVTKMLMWHKIRGACPNEWGSLTIDVGSKVIFELRKFS